MLDELKEEEIVNKVGGRFKLSTLIQKRMVALNTGAKPLVQVPGGDRLQTVVQEILQDKIFLDVAGELQSRNATATANIAGNVFGSQKPAPIPTTQARDAD
ncbi:DNA-directed RNA polymerase subunit omega [Limnoglobus roseus]|uniref:DNA-directed RNA polymerase subunit omega n=1 Tax=Limnoglobus roseus TaxID=2598579 RepID=A0A5C1AFA6_9BACT|nr:DNA-directed RNA polymerase subunit omega [Limnoglobus roseus]QEL17245.1 DNA-directed RNA polymerase subunit omega [Limnoglobus roseus]